MGKASASEETVVTERRGSGRVTLRTTVSLSSETNFYTGFSDNLSEGGLFVSTHNLLPTGTRVQLDFSLPDEQERFLLQAEVRWIRSYNPSSDTDPGLGFRFVDLTDDDRGKIEEFLGKRQAIFYDDEGL